jgi:microcystin-dependent protein
MTTPFVAEIMMFAGNFAPRGWALCNGQLLPISQNTALFSLLGTYYGGNGVSTFALPNLQDRAALGAGQGAGLTERVLGETGGAETVTLLQSEMPAHSHGVNASASLGTQTDPTNAVWAAGGAVRGGGPPTYATGQGTPAPLMHTQALSVAGSSFPHNNMPPFQAVTFIIALQGVFPPRG